MNPLWIGIGIGAFGAPLLVGIGAIAAAGIDRMREQRRHRRLIESLGPPTSAAGKLRTAVTLEGRVMTDTPVVTFHPYGASFLEEPNVYAVSHAPRVVIDLDGGGRALLDGDTQVVVGSLETEHKAPLDLAETLEAKELAAAKVRTRLGQFRVVRAGDRVRVHGVAELAPDDDALYRETSKAFRLTPAPPESPGVPAAIPIAAVDVVLRRRLTGTRSRTLALAAALVLGAAGGAAVPARAPAAPLEASLPKGIEGPPPCRTALLEHGDAGAPCDDAYARAVVRYMAGDFAEASAGFEEAVAKDPSIPPSLDEAETHLFVHDYRAANDTVDRMLRIFYPGPSTAEKRDLECIQGLLRARLESNAGPVMEGWHHQPFRRLCSLRPFAKLARELDAVGGYDGEGDGDQNWKDYVNGVYLLPGARDPLAVPRTSAFGTRDRLRARPVGVEKRVLDKLGLDQHAYGKLIAFGVSTSEADYYAFTSPFAAELALFYAFSGFPDRAAKYWPMIDAVADVEERHGHFHQVKWKGDEPKLEEERLLLESVLSVASAAALFAGDRTRAIRYGTLGEPHSGHIVLQLERMLRPGASWEEPAEDGHWPPHNQIFFAAQNTGDASAVVKVFVEQKATGRETLERILPLLKTNKDALNRWFDSSSYPAPCLTCGASSFHGHLSDRHEVARLLGAKDDGKALARFTDALTDDEIAFDLDELETFFSRNNHER